MISADLVVQDCRRLVTCAGPIPKRKASLQDVGPAEKVWIASSKGKIVFIGKEKDFRKSVRLERSAVRLDAGALLGLPGFVDSHTHLPFAGNRVEEFRLRLQGYRDQALAAKGMGIQTTVKATRRVTKRDLLTLVLKRLHPMAPHRPAEGERQSG